MCSPCELRVPSVWYQLLHYWTTSPVHQSTSRVTGQKFGLNLDWALGAGARWGQSTSSLQQSDYGTDGLNVQT
jgi:hypothetical protein